MPDLARSRLLAAALLTGHTTLKSILCYGDSNTWGLNPADNHRYDLTTRWPGVLATRLGEGYHVIEEGLAGRTTVRDDPLERDKNGLTTLPACLKSHQPLDLVILMLGTNDLKQRFALSPEAVAASARALVDTILACPCGADGTAPPVLLLAPPPVVGLTTLAHMFAGAEAKSLALAPLYESVARECGCRFLDTAAVAPVSPLDGVHLSAASHARLAEAVATQVRALLRPPLSL